MSLLLLLNSWIKQILLAGQADFIETVGTL